MSSDLEVLSSLHDEDGRINDLDRCRLVIDVLDRVPGLQPGAANLRQAMVEARLDARRYGREHGEDPPEISEWCWTD